MQRARVHVWWEWVLARKESAEDERLCAGLEHLWRLVCIGEIRRGSRMKHKDQKNQEIVCIKPSDDQMTAASLDS